MQEAWRWRVPEFKGQAQHGEPVSTGEDAARAIARLPGVEIEITRRRAAEGDAEHVSIILTALPSFEAFARAFEAANPFALWMRGAELAWRPWIEATRAMGLPWSASPSLAPPDADGGAGKKDASR
jgi:hypothetical protein